MSFNLSEPAIISLPAVKSALSNIELFKAISKGFIAYSKGEAVIPPVGELLFKQPPGEVHIKYGYIISQPYYVVKIASGFYENPSLDLSSSQGLNLLFDKNTGLLRCILLDQGYLTDLRTAVAGALATKTLASTGPKRVGILGAGIQSRLQLEYHQKVLEIEEVFYWNRNLEKAKALIKDSSQENFPISVLSDLEELCQRCNVIITTTASTSILIKNNWVQPGTHITAIGSDMAEKIELDPALLQRAEILVVDSIAQSQSRGEVFRARKEGLLNKKKLIELGTLLENDQVGRKHDQEISIVDLTGLAVQDLMISQSVFETIYPLK